MWGFEDIKVAVLAIFLVFPLLIKVDVLLNESAVLGTWKLPLDRDQGRKVAVEPLEFSFLEKLLDREHRLRENVVVVKKPAVFSPVFWSFRSHCFT
jgi:hypothetical protein